jgi:hypothetical protein
MSKQETETAPDHLKPVRERLAKLLARKQWEKKLGRMVLECWTTRTGRTYLLQIWPDTAWTVWGELGHDDQPATIDKIV